jgi:hypothetical protein
MRLRISTRRVTAVLTARVRSQIGSQTSPKSHCCLAHSMCTGCSYSRDIVTGAWSWPFSVN